MPDALTTGAACAALAIDPVFLPSADVADSGIFRLTWPVGPPRQMSVTGTVSQRSPASRRNTVARLRASDQQAIEDLAVKRVEETERRRAVAHRRHRRLITGAPLIGELRPVELDAARGTPRP